ncbi:MAG: hypothetical protein ACI9GW_003058 [Halieaceae bacterium]|jgi:hypothetical protein
MQQFQVNKSNFAQTRTIDTPAVSALAQGDIRVRINRFAFTANNITYAAAGDMLGYWQFFPPLGDDSEGWGVIPVWGFAEIIESQVDGLPIGERLFGYFPPADLLDMSPKGVTHQRLVDGAEHRSQLPPGYNMYRRVAAEPGYDSSMDNERMLLWPLFITSFCLCDSLLFNDWYGAEQVIIISASSKTSIGLAYALYDDETAPAAVGVTSSRNLNLVTSLNLYDSAITYEDIEKIDASVPTVIVDMSGNSSVLGRMHSHLGENMKHCVNVGITHWEATGDNPDINTERSEFFFAPAHIQMRIKEWGVEGFDEKTANFIKNTVAKSRSWLKLKTLPGLQGLESIYPDVCAGAVAPDEGIIIEN